MAPEIVIDMAKRSYYPAKGFHALYEHNKMIAGRSVDGEFILSNKVHQSVGLPESQSEGRNGVSNEGISCKVKMTGNGGSNSEAEQTGMLLVQQPQPQPKTKDTLVGGRHASGLNSLLSVDHPLKDSAASLNLARTDTISLGRKRKLDDAIDNKCAVVGCGVSSLAAADSVNKVALLQERNNAWLQLNDGTSSNLAPIISSGQGDIRDPGEDMNVVSSEMFSKGSRSTIERSSSEPEETNMLQVLVQLPQPQTQQQQQQQQQQGTLNEGSNTSGLSSLPCEVGAFKASAVSLNAALQMMCMAICAINCESVDSGHLAANDVQGNMRCLNVTLPQGTISEPGEPEHDSNADKRTASSMTWLVATAAPHHATGNRALLSGYTPERGELFLHVGGGRAAAPMRVLGRGAVVTDAVKLPDVWYVPGLAANLVSVGQLAELGYSVAFGRGTCRVRSAADAASGGDVVVGEARAGEGGVFELDFLRVPLGI